MVLPTRGVPPLLRTVRGQERFKESKPLEEPEDVTAPPMSDSEEDELDPIQHCQDSSDDVGIPARGDMGRTAFIPKKPLASANGTKGYGGMKGSSKDADVPPGHSVRSKKRAVDDVEDAEAEESDLFSSSNSKKAKKSEAKGLSDLGSHMRDGFMVERQKKPQKAVFGKKGRNSKVGTLSRDSTPRRSFQMHEGMSASPSPEKAKKFKNTRLDLDLSSPVAPKSKLSKGIKSQAQSDSSELSELDSSVCSDPPRALKSSKKAKPTRRQPKKGKMKNVKELTPEDMSQQPKFMMPEGYDDFATQNELAPVDMLTREDLERGKKADLGPDKASCPMCDEPVDKQWLGEFSRNKRMTIARQAKFCHLHKKRSAKDIYAAKGYPEIRWESLESRIAGHHGFLESLINGEASHYGDAHLESINTGKNRTLLKTEDYLTPGYYGLRGMSIMTEAIIEMFSTLLRERAPRYKLISARGYTGFVQSVLVPELAVKLIRDDMSLGDDDEARVVMEESRAIGEILHDERRESQSQARSKSGSDGQESAVEEEEEKKKLGANGKASGGGENVSVTLRMQEIDDSDSSLSSLASLGGKPKPAAPSKTLKFLDSDSDLSSIASPGGDKPAAPRKTLEILDSDSDLSSLPDL